MAFIPVLQNQILSCPSSNPTIQLIDGTTEVPLNPNGWNGVNTLYSKQSLGSPYVTCSTITVKRDGVRIGCPVDVLTQIQTSVDLNLAYVLNNFSLIDGFGNTRLYDGDYEVIWEIIDNEGNKYNTTNKITISCGNVGPSEVYNLDLKISACEDDCGCGSNCSNIKIKDVTGLYDAINNPRGWDDLSTVYRYNGLPNVVSAELEIKKDGQPLTGSPFNVLPKVQAATDETYLLYKIDNISDGIYEGILTITDSDCNVYQAEFIKPVYCNVKCCVSKLAADIAEETCECKSKKYNIFQKANVYLKALKILTCCLREKQFTSILTKLKSICYGGSCNCGCK